jgi:type I restriction enzyme S subunit
MKTYITKPKSIRKSQILGKEFSLSGFSFRMVEFRNSNIKKLETLLVENKKGFEAGSDEYINFSENYFVRISDLNNLNYTFDLKPDTQKIRPPKTINKLIKGDICYQTASDVGNVCIYDNDKPAYYNSHIRKLKFDEQIKFYVFGILKSNFGKNQVDVAGSIKGVDNFREEYLLNTKISFPTTTNHPEPKKVQDLVSVLVQNIIDKEEQIKAKNQKIDELIERELNDNQKENTFSYKLPKISEIKAENRLDTGLYESDYQTNIFLVKNYNSGFFQIPFNNLKTGQTPADYYYPSEKVNSEVSLWLTPRNLSKNVLTEKLWIHTKKENTLKDLDIIFGSRGTVGDVFLYSEKDLGKAYINQSTTGITIDGDLSKKVFVLSYFSSIFFKQMLSKFVYNGTVPAITPDILVSFLIPSFPESKQQEIAKEYYNLVVKNSYLTLENYLEKEKVRNSQLGIFQLNIEIFELREKLEDLVDKIVNEIKVEISF